MTPTEAIRHLGALSAFANADEVKAVEMAIEALSKGPSIADMIAGVDLDFSRKKPKPASVEQIMEDVKAMSRIPYVPLDLPLWMDHPVFSQPAPRITRNAIECGVCGEVIESKHPHDYKACKCGGCIVDGGLERLARSGGNFIERSEWS